MNGRLIAEVRYGATAHVRATKIIGVNGKAWWFRIRLGARRMLTCDCGGAVKHMPDALTYEDSWGGCSHIVALYKGNVTSDPRKETAAYYVSERIGGSDGVHFMRLTQLGERIFYPRWVALKLG